MVEDQQLQQPHHPRAVHPASHRCATRTGRVEADARATITLSLADAIEQLNAKNTDLQRQFRKVLALHPDAHIFARLPKGGMVRAATPAGRDR